MTDILTILESRRMMIQAQLDLSKDQGERNRMGQFSTPTKLAYEILEYAKAHLDNPTNTRFIDPAIGTGAFFSALLTTFPPDSIVRAVGYEIDPHYGKPAAELWKDTVLELRLEDFTLATPPLEKDRFNILICNPPYVRHHHIDRREKQRLKALLRAGSGMDINGLAGLYCYFLGLSHQWISEGDWQVG